MRHSLFRCFQWGGNFDIKKIKYILNFGPQHPSAHGVLRLILQMRGELIDKVDIHIGLLHRNTEYLITKMHFEKALPYFDRLDYISVVTQEHAYCLVLEKLLLNKFYSININSLRIIFDELTRILNHLLAISCHALDVGNMSCLFWCFELRENIMNFYERISGARMHAALYRPNIIKKKLLSTQFIYDILKFIPNVFTTLNEMHNLLTYNKIWKQRLVNIGLISVSAVHNYGLTGVMARSTGIKKDLRLCSFNSYSGYNKFKFRSFLGINGDCYDRYLIRMFEMSESLQIISSVCQKFIKKNVRGTLDIEYLLKYFDKYLPRSRTFKPKISNVYTSMENLIIKFLRWHSGIFITKGSGYVGIESPKGEFGVTVISKNSTFPNYCKIRSPCYHHLQFLSKLACGGFLSDLSTILGSIDIVFGEIDR